MKPWHVDNLAAFVEYERWRATVHREFHQAGCAWMLDDEPERRWWFPPRPKTVTHVADARPARR